MVFMRSSAEELFRTLAQIPPADGHGKPSVPRVSETSVNIHDLLVKKVLASGGIRESSSRTDDIDNDGDASASKWPFRKPATTFSAFLAPRELRQLAAAVGSLAGPDPSSGRAGGASGGTTSAKSLRKHHDASACSAHVSSLPVLNLALDYLQAIPDLLLTHAGSPACRAMLACCRSGALLAFLAELRRCASADPCVFGSPVGKATAELLLGLARSHDTFLEASASPSSRDGASSDSALTGGTAARASSAGADVQAVVGEVVLALARHCIPAGLAEAGGTDSPGGDTAGDSGMSGGSAVLSLAEALQAVFDVWVKPHVGGGSGGAAGSATILGRSSSSGGGEGGLAGDDLDGRRPSASSEQLTSLLTSGAGAVGDAGHLPGAEGAVELVGAVPVGPWRLQLLAGAFRVAAAVVGGEDDGALAGKRGGAAGSAGEKALENVVGQYVAATSALLSNSTKLLQLRRQEAAGMSLAARAEVAARLHAAESAAAFATSAVEGGRASLRAVKGVRALCLQVADACSRSAWRKIPACEDLFSAVLSAAARLAVRQSEASGAGREDAEAAALQETLLPMRSLVLAAAMQSPIPAASPTPTTALTATRRAPMVASVVGACSLLLQATWASGDHARVKSFLLSLGSYMRQPPSSQDEQQRASMACLRHNLAPILVEVAAAARGATAVTAVVPLLLEAVRAPKEDPAIRHEVLRALAAAAVAAAGMGQEGPYREVAVLLLWEYGREAGEVQPQVEVLSSVLAQLASGLSRPSLRDDFLRRLLATCAEVALATEAEGGSRGAELLGPLLPAVAAACRHVDPLHRPVDPSLQRLFRNLWFYCALFRLAPPLHSSPASAAATAAAAAAAAATSAEGAFGAASSNTPDAAAGGGGQGVSGSPSSNPPGVLATCTGGGGGGKAGGSADDLTKGPYAWRAEWAAAMRHIAAHTPPLAVGAFSRLDDELELAALHRPGSQRGSGNEQAAVRQRNVLGAAVGSRLDASVISSITGVKATNLLSIVLLESLRVSAATALVPVPDTTPHSPARGEETSQVAATGEAAGVVAARQRWEEGSENRSAVTCLLEYIQMPNPRAAVRHCLSAVVLRAFHALLLALEHEPSDTVRQAALSAHACALLDALWDGQEFVRDTARTMLSLLRKAFPHLLWHPRCIRSLLRFHPPQHMLASVGEAAAEAAAGVGGGAGGGDGEEEIAEVAWDPEAAAAAEVLAMDVAKDWLATAFLLAPLVTQALVEEVLRGGDSDPESVAGLLSVLADIKHRPRGSAADSTRSPFTLAAQATVAASLKAHSMGQVAGLLSALSSLPAASTGISGTAGTAAVTFGTAGLEAHPPAHSPYKHGAGIAVGSHAAAKPDPHVTLLQAAVTQMEALVEGGGGGGEMGQGVVSWGHMGGEEGRRKEKERAASVAADAEKVRDRCLWAVAALVLVEGQQRGHQRGQHKGQQRGQGRRRASPHQSALELRLIHLLARTPLRFFTPQSLRACCLAWAWLLAALPRLSAPLLSQIAAAWGETVAGRRGVFRALQGDEEGPRGWLRPLVVGGVPEGFSDHKGEEAQALEELGAHAAWITFISDCSEMYGRGSESQAAAIERLLLASLSDITRLSRHPAARAPLFDLFRLALSFARTRLLVATNPARTAAAAGAAGVAGAGAVATSLAAAAAVADVSRSDAATSPHVFSARLLRDRAHRAVLKWFSVDAGYFDGWPSALRRQAALEEMAVMDAFSKALADDDTMEDAFWPPPAGATATAALSPASHQQRHPVWGAFFSQHRSQERQQRRRLLALLTAHEGECSATWAFPLGFAPDASRTAAAAAATDIQRSRARVTASLSPNDVPPLVRAAWAVDPRVAVCLVQRFPSVKGIQDDVGTLIRSMPLQVRSLPEALRWVVTPAAVQQDSPLLRLPLPYWAPCSVAAVLNLLLPAFKGHPRVMAYAFRVLEAYPPPTVTFFMPQLVQALRYDHDGLVESYLLRAALRNIIFAHILIWQLQGEEADPEGQQPPALESSNGAAAEGGASGEGATAAAATNILWTIVPRVRQRIIDSFNAEQRAAFDREFSFFDAVTSISGTLRPVPKEKRRAAIQPELEKIKLPGDDVYLPTDPNMLVRSIVLDSGIPLQSAKKVPILISFMVVRKDEDGVVDEHKPVKQGCIFKVGDDCRQDVLALQVIALLRDINKAVGLDLYLFPYGVLPTGYERGIIQVVPNTRSRNQMGDVTDGGLFDIFQNEFGAIGSAGFERARHNFIVSSAAYAVASLLLQPKDRHNGNLLVDNDGRLVHIDFGFILETSPAGNLRFESAQFKLSHEMTQILDPSGDLKSEPWRRFVGLCVKGYLAARRHQDAILNTVQLMLDSGLPCFSRGDAVGNLRKRFHPEMGEREAASFMIATCAGGGNTGSGGSKGGGRGGGGGGGSGGGGGDASNGGVPPSGLQLLALSYMASLESRPFVTKGITAGLLNALADLFCQVVVEKDSSIDVRRLGGFAAIGLFIVGPALHIWYGLLGKFIQIEGFKGVLARLLIDQVIFSPLSIATFVGLVLLLEGKPGRIVPKLEKDFVPTCINMWKLWVPFQLFNFALVPPQLQVGAVNLVGLVWTVYMSFASHNDISDAKSHEKKEAASA
ncbi:unnamed protein product [Closterium sp. Naga37s-1]|nr:unnamed protein product [Closterium sp. Naga37s-1]